VFCFIQQDTPFLLFPPYTEMSIALLDIKEGAIFLEDMTLGGAEKS
jgi:hypothetical protein